MEKKWKLHFIVLVYFSSNVNYFVLVISFYYYQFCLFQKKNQKIKKSQFYFCRIHFHFTFQHLPSLCRLITSKTLYLPHPPLIPFHYLRTQQDFSPLSQLGITTPPHIGIIDQRDKEGAAPCIWKKKRKKLGSCNLSCFCP